MKITFKILNLSVILTVILLLNNTIYGKNITRKDMPSSVILSFRKAYPNAKVLSYSKERREGATVFEIESKDGNQRRDIIYSADGSAIEIEERVLSGELPTAIQQTLHNKYSKGRIKSAERITRGSRVDYEVLIKENMTVYTIILDQNGKISKVQQ